MTTQDKFIGCITIAHASLGVFWTTWIASHIGFSISFFGLNILLAGAGLAAGIGWLRNIRWASYLLLLFYVIQLVHVVTHEFQFSFTLGFNLNIALGWFAPTADLGFNLFAFAMLLWANFRPRFKESARSEASVGGA